jgi:hypothetical protein
MSSTNQTPIKPKPRKERPIPRRLVQVIDALLDGTCKSQRAACERFNLSESYVSRPLKKDKIRAFVTRRTRETIAASQLPATATVLRLLENARSEHVQFDAAKHMMALNGYHANPLAPESTSTSAAIGPVTSSNSATVTRKYLRGDVRRRWCVARRRLTDEERRNGVQTTPRHPAMIGDANPDEDEQRPLLH